MIEVACDVCGKDVPAEVIKTPKGFIREHMTRPMKLLPGAEETLYVLKDRYRLLMLTKGDNYVWQSKIDRSHLAGYFEETIIEAGWNTILIPYHLTWDMETHKGDFHHDRLHTLIFSVAGVNILPKLETGKLCCLSHNGVKLGAFVFCELLLFVEARQAES